MAVTDIHYFMSPRPMEIVPFLKQHSVQIISKMLFYLLIILAKFVSNCPHPFPRALRSAVRIPRAHSDNFYNYKFHNPINTIR